MSSKINVIGAISGHLKTLRNTYLLNIGNRYPCGRSAKTNLIKTKRFHLYRIFEKQKHAIFLMLYTFIKIFEISWSNFFAIFILKVDNLSNNRWGKVFKLQHFSYHSFCSNKFATIFEIYNIPFFYTIPRFSFTLVPTRFYCFCAI